MNSIMIIGIDKIGIAAAEYICRRFSGTLPCCAIASDKSSASASVPIRIAAESGELSDEMIREIIGTEIVGQIIVLTGFAGRFAVKTVSSFQKWCESRGIGLTVTGVTPFSFEGSRKIRDAHAGISELQDLGVTLIAFSNSELQSELTAKTSLEKAAEFNFERICSEIVMPIMHAEPQERGCLKSSDDSLPQIFTQAEPLSARKKSLSRRRKIITAAVSAAVGALLASALLFFGLI